MIKPCPWCDALPRIGDDGTGWHYIRCENPFCEIQPAVKCMSKSEPLRIWNKRERTITEPCIKHRDAECNACWILNDAVKEALNVARQSLMGDVDAGKAVEKMDAILRGNK